MESNSSTLTNIEKGIPLPVNAYMPKFELMEPGDSFSIAGDAAHLATIRASVSRFGRQTGRKFTVRLTAEVGEVARCWRLS